MIHGLAFANLLRFVLAADQNFAWDMFSFSLGLETGQILVVLAILLLAQLFIGVLKIPRRIWAIVVSLVVLGFAIQMATERWPKEKKGRRRTETGAVLIQKNHWPTVPVNSDAIQCA